MELLPEFLVLFLAVTTTTSISTIHHDKSESVTISALKTTFHSTESTVLALNVTLNPADRKKRLLPYENFYLKQNFNKPLAYIEQNDHYNNGEHSNSGYSSHHQQFKDLIEGRLRKKQHHGHADGLRFNGKFTPFSESNAIPGPLRPMIPQPRPVVPAKVEYMSLNPPPIPHEEIEQGKGPPDFSAIYDTLSQTKLRQQELQKLHGYQAGLMYQNQGRPQNQQEAYENRDLVYKTIEPSKTYIETFTATNIDVTAPASQQYEFSKQPGHRYVPTYNQKSTYRDQTRKTYNRQQVSKEVPKSGYLVEYQRTQAPRKLQHSKERPRNHKPYFFLQRNPEGDKSQVILVRKPKPVAVIEENNFVADKYVPYLPLKFNPHAYTPQEAHYETSPASYYQEEYVYQPSYSVNSNYRAKGNPKRPQSYQTIIQGAVEKEPQKYLVGPNNQRPESYNVRDGYEVATPHPQYEIVTSKPRQKYQDGQKYMVVEINPESQSYKVVSPKPQLIEIIKEEPAAKYPVQQYQYQLVTPNSIFSTARPDLQQPHEIGETRTNRYHESLLLTTARPEIQKHPDINEEDNTRYHDSILPSTTRPKIEEPQEINDEYGQNLHQQYEQVGAMPTKYQNFEVPKYQVVEEPKYEQVKVPKYQEIEEHEEEQNPNGLAHILKQLQETNTLPQTLTPDNIDNSIKTLVRILDALKSRQKQNKPVLYHEDYQDDLDNEAGVDLGGPDSELDTPDGGTPGKPGVDYPALSNIPQTSFSCKTQRYKGFFGDPDTNCQVWHYCDLNGGQASFLCPNGTIFSQVALTCDWWFNVKCSSTAQLYVLNERLYKYIIPLAPKFPEDYSGPLVDKYLALKFQEMEEKLKKQKKGKGNTDSEEDEKENDEDDSTEKDHKEGESEGEEEKTTSSEALAIKEQRTLEQEDKIEK